MWGVTNTVCKDCVKQAVMPVTSATLCEIIEHTAPTFHIVKSNSMYTKVYMGYIY